MSARFPLDPFAVPSRPDISIPMPIRGRANRLRAGVKAICVIGVFVAASLVLAVVLFVPILAVEIARIDAVVLAGQTLEAWSYSARLGDLFLGTLIVAFSVLAFLTSVMLSSGTGVPQPMQNSSQNAHAEPTYEDSDTKLHNAEERRA